MKHFFRGVAGAVALLAATTQASAFHARGSVMAADRGSERLLALTIWAEGRSRGPVGMSSIGHVVINRSRADGFGGSMARIVWKHRQFSCWRPGDPNRRAMRNISSLPKDGADWRQWQMAKKIAHDLLHERRRDPTRGATYYATRGMRPPWARGMRQVALLGGHRFYRPLSPPGLRVRS